MSSAGLPARSGVGAPSPDGKGLGPHSPTSPATPNPTGQSPHAAVSVSSARAEASRKNGAKSRGPKTEEGKARSAQNALKHGMRAQKYLVLPEDAHEFAVLEAAMVAELAPVDHFITEQLATTLCRHRGVPPDRLKSLSQKNYARFRAPRHLLPVRNPG